MRAVHSVILLLSICAILFIQFNLGGCKTSDVDTPKGVPSRKSSGREAVLKIVKDPKTGEEIQLIRDPETGNWMSRDDIERRKLKRMTVSELFKYIKSEDFYDAKLIEEEMRRRGLDEELFEFLLKRLRRGSLDDMATALSWLKRVAELIKHEWALQIWEAVSKRFERSKYLIRLFGEGGLISFASEVLTKSQLEKEAYPAIARRIVEMGKVYQPLLAVAGEYWGEAAIEPLLEAEEWARRREEKYDDESLSYLYWGFRGMKDPDAADDLWELLRKREDIAEYLMEGFLRCGGEPERELIVKWLKQDIPNPSLRYGNKEKQRWWEAERRRINSTLIAGCLAAVKLKDDREVMEQVKRIYLSTDYRHTTLKGVSMKALVEMLPATSEFLADLLSDPKKATDALTELLEKVDESTILTREGVEWIEGSVARSMKENPKLMNALEQAVYDERLRNIDRQRAADILHYLTKDEKWRKELKRLMKESR